MIFRIPPVKRSNAIKFYYTFADEIVTEEDAAWYLNHGAQWIYNGQDVTHPEDYAVTISGNAPSQFTPTDTLYVTVTNLTTGCRTRKTAGANGFE
jgi:hypothetical protein